PVSTFQTRAVWSQDVETTSWLLGLNRAHQTSAWCSNGFCALLKVRASHSCAVLSQEAVTSHRPSGLNSAQSTLPSCCRTAISVPVPASQTLAAPPYEA